MFNVKYNLNLNDNEEKMLLKNNFLKENNGLFMEIQTYFSV